ENIHGKGEGRHLQPRTRVLLALRRDPSSQMHRQSLLHPRARSRWSLAYETPPDTIEYPPAAVPFYQITVFSRPLMIESVDQLRKEVIPVIVRPHPVGKENHAGCVDVGGCHQLAQAAGNNSINV